MFDALTRPLNVSDLPTVSLRTVQIDIVVGGCPSAVAAALAEETEARPAVKAPASMATATTPAKARRTIVFQRLLTRPPALEHGHFLCAELSGSCPLLLRVQGEEVEFLVAFEVDVLGREREGLKSVGGEAAL